MISKFKLAMGSVAVALSLGVTVPASAAILSITLGVGVSKDFQNAPPLDLSSKFGASLAGSTLSFDTTTGDWTVHLENLGAGNMTGFALSLNPAVFGNPLAAHTFSFSVDSCAVDGCSFVDSSPPSGTVVDGFENGGGTFDIGTARTNQGGASNGLATGESADFGWNFAVGDLNLAGVTSFFDLIDPLAVSNDGDCVSGNGNDCVSFNAFWVAHIQSLGPNGDDSDHIGGSRGNPGIVPEPGILLLLGAGLAGMGLVALRRKNRWID